MRFIRRQGFGIQSPWAYSFVKDVLYEKLRYYAYDDLIRLYPERRKTDVRRDEQLFRLVNYFQPSVILVVGECSDCSVEYMRVAGPRVKVTGVTADVLPDIENLSAPFIYIGSGISLETGCRVVDMKMACDGGCWTLVVDGIDRRNKRLWQSLLEFADGVLTFDMKYRGVAFFDSHRISHNYVV